MKLSLCPLTGYSLQNAEFPTPTDSSITYILMPVGKVRLGMSTLINFINKPQEKHPDLAGICRNAFENGEEPPLIDEQFITTGIRNLDIPKTFVEKARCLLLFMYHKGGKDFTDFKFMSSTDYPLCYATEKDEFKKVIEHLERKNWIEVRSPLRIASDIMVYNSVTMTEAGIAEAEKALPKIPMIGLVDQQIATGDPATDAILNNAKKLFFETPQTLAAMRSACESLSFVLEPLRSDCETMFGNPDTNAFFQIVNTFDIRHNKENTRTLQYPEQLEWIFYSLLNTINTYYKMKSRQ